MGRPFLFDVYFIHTFLIRCMKICRNGLWLNKLLRLKLAIGQNIVAGKQSHS